MVSLNPGGREIQDNEQAHNIVERVGSSVSKGAKSTQVIGPNLKVKHV